MPITLDKAAQAAIQEFSTITTTQTRILLALWTMEQATRSELKASLVRKRDRENSMHHEQRVREHLDSVAMLDRAEAFVVQGNKISLSAQGLSLLEQGLLNPEFSFDAQIGAKTANALLRWMQQRTVSSVVSSNGKSSEHEITSYEEFKIVALDVFDRLNRDFNLDNLVPIYRIRRTIGDRVGHGQFSEWLFSMQSEDLVQLLEESVEDSATDKIQDSVVTKLGKLRCYAKRFA